MVARQKRQAPLEPARPRSAELELAIAEFSASLRHGDVADHKRRHLVPLTPDPSIDVAAKYPAIAKLLEGTSSIVFAGSDLTELEQRILLRLFNQIKFSPFNALMELLDRLPNARAEIDKIVERGVPRTELVAAMLMAPQELQAKLAGFLPRILQRLGRRVGQLRNYARMGEGLLIDPRILRDLADDAHRRIEAIQALQATIAKFLRSTSRLTRQTKSPLVHDPRVRVASVLIHHGYQQGEAFRVTASLLRAWHRHRFHGLDEMHVRQTYTRAGRARRLKSRAD